MRAAPETHVMQTILVPTFFDWTTPVALQPLYLHRPFSSNASSAALVEKPKGNIADWTAPCGTPQRFSRSIGRAQLVSSRRFQDDFKNDVANASRESRGFCKENGFQTDLYPAAFSRPRISAYVHKDNWNDAGASLFGKPCADSQATLHDQLQYSCSNLLVFSTALLSAAFIPPNKRNESQHDHATHGSPRHVIRSNRTSV